MCHILLTPGIDRQEEGSSVISQTKEGAKESAEVSQVLLPSFTPL